jgi:hypothetical protein
MVATLWKTQRLVIRANGGYLLENSAIGHSRKRGLPPPTQVKFTAFYPIIRIETFINGYKRFNTTSHFFRPNFTAGEGSDLVPSLIFCFKMEAVNGGCLREAQAPEWCI